MTRARALHLENLVKGKLGFGGPDLNEVQRGERLLGELAPILDAQLSGKQWVLGDRLTLADLALATPLSVTESAKIPLKSYKNMMAWFGRVQELDAWKRTSA